MDTDDLDLVLVGNEPSMSVVSSFPGHSQPLGTSATRDFERHTLPMTPKSCTGNSGNCMWHASILNANHDHTQHSTSLQNNSTQPLMGGWDGNLSAKVKRIDDGTSGPVPKENMTPSSFPQPMELPHRGKDQSRDSEDYGAPPPVTPLTLIYEVKKKLIVANSLLHRLL